MYLCPHPFTHQFSTNLYVVCSNTSHLTLFPQMKFYHKPNSSAADKSSRRANIFICLKATQPTRLSREQTSFSVSVSGNDKRASFSSQSGVACRGQILKHKPFCLWLGSKHYDIKVMTLEHAGNHLGKSLGVTPDFVVRNMVFASAG